MTTLTATPATIADLYAARAAGETTAAMLTDGRDILDISRNDDGTYHLWTSLGEVSNVVGGRMVIAPPARTPIKTITYDRKTGDYKMELDGEFVGYAACYHAAEVELDRLAYEQLDRAGVELELLQSATALDGGSSVEEIAAEYAEALPIPAPETVLSGFTPYAAHLLSNPDDLRSYLHARSIDELRALAQLLGVYQPSMRRRVVLIEAITPKCTLPSDDQPTDNPGDTITLPDPAECPDVCAPQPVEDLPRCEQRAVAPSMALWGPDTPECPKCGTRHDPVVPCPVSARVAVEPERGPLPPSWSDRPDFYIVTNGQEYAYWKKSGYWDTTARFGGECLLVEGEAREVLGRFNGWREEDEDEPAWSAFLITRLTVSGAVDLTG